jgi:adenosine deaminase
MDVLREEEDFYELAMHYFRRAAAQNVVYVEPFFDPQAHTSRGVAFDTVINGIHRAQRDAAAAPRCREQPDHVFSARYERGVRRRAPGDGETAYRQADRRRPGFRREGQPAVEVRRVFADARALGLKLTMHCDVNQKDILDHIRECLDLIEVDRIDHGVNALEDEALCTEIAQRGLGLTVCPVSNRFVVQNLTGEEIRQMLARGMKATINSDDPAYFRAYMNENLQALVDEAGFSRDELRTLTRNAFEVSWLPEERKAHYLARVDQVH